SDHFLVERLVDLRSAGAEDPDGSATDIAYADAFRSAGIDVDSVDPAETGTWIRVRSDGGARSLAVVRALVAALDDWTGVRKSRGRGESEWSRLVAAARAADPDRICNALRALLLVADQAVPPVLELDLRDVRKSSIPRSVESPPKRLDQLRLLAEKLNAP